MEREHTPTIIQLIPSTDLALIQLKDSLKVFVLSTYHRPLYHHLNTRRKILLPGFGSQHLFNPAPTSQDHAMCPCLYSETSKYS